MQDLILLDEKITVTTTEGDVVQITGDFHVESQNRNINVNKTQKAHRLNFITKLQGQMKSMTMLEKGERIIYVAGEASIVYAFSLQDHDIIGMGLMKTCGAWATA